MNQRSKHANSNYFRVCRRYMQLRGIERATVFRIAYTFTVEGWRGEITTYYRLHDHLSKGLFTVNALQGQRTGVPSA